MFPSVSPRAVKETWLRKFKAHADRILDALAPQGRADLTKAFVPLSAECLKDITGLTNMPYQDMDAWSPAKIDGIANYSRGRRGQSRRRSDPGRRRRLAENNISVHRACRAAGPQARAMPVRLSRIGRLLCADCRPLCG
jgi:hypothetical protein